MLFKCVSSDYNSNDRKKEAASVDLVIEQLIKNLRVNSTTIDTLRQLLQKDELCVNQGMIIKVY